MPAIKSVAEIANKWARVAPTRSADFEAGVKAPKKNWEAETKAAASRQAEGVAKAITEKRFEKGVAKATQAKWSRKVTTIGVERWPRGIEVATPDYTSGFAPYRDVIERADIGMRFPAGDPRNYDRVKKMGDALHSAKIAAVK